MLFLTENYAALNILNNFKYLSNSTKEDNEPFILFGSSFPKDNEYTQVCAPKLIFICKVS